MGGAFVVFAFAPHAENANIITTPTDRMKSFRRRFCWAHLGHRSCPQQSLPGSPEGSPERPEGHPQWLAFARALTGASVKRELRQPPKARRAISRHWAPPVSRSAAPYLIPDAN
jgi:hypothetical protein